MLKAVAGGGGRGMRRVIGRRTWRRLRALPLGGQDGVRRWRTLRRAVFLPSARHVEVQIVGDGSGAVVHLWDRECSLQRQRQKLVEIAPACGLADERPPTRCSRRRRRMAGAVDYAGLGTIEFLVRCDRRGRRSSSSSKPIRGCRSSTPSPRKSPDWIWCGLQLEIAGGRSLADLGLAAGATFRARAVSRSRPGSTWRPWARWRRSSPTGRRDRDLRAAVGPRRSRRRLRLCRLPHQRRATTRCWPR